MRSIYLTIVLSCLSTLAVSATPFEEGLNAYSSADYPQAITLFSRALEDNEPSAEAYYNLGAAYYKNGDIAPAILNFSRAYRLDPADQDTRYNLNLVSSQIVDNMEPMPKLFLSEWINDMSHWFTLGTWRILGVIFIVLTLIGIFLYFRGRSVGVCRGGFYGAIVALILGILSHALAYQSYCFTHDTKEAILMSGVVTVKSSPDASSKDIVVIHEGLKVEVLQRLSGFSEVLLPDGTKGWIPIDAYEKINNFSQDIR